MTGDSANPRRGDNVSFCEGAAARGIAGGDAGAAVPRVAADAPRMGMRGGREPGDDGRGGKRGGREPADDARVRTRGGGGPHDDVRMRTRVGEESADDVRLRTRGERGPDGDARERTRGGEPELVATNESRRGVTAASLDVEKSSDAGFWHRKVLFPLPTLARTPSELSGVLATAATGLGASSIAGAAAGPVNAGAALDDECTCAADAAIAAAALLRR